MNVKNFLKQAMALGLLTGASAVYAITAANTVITNTASLNYTGLTSPITASVDVTVDLTPTASSFGTTPPADQTTADSQSVTYTYTIVAAANGQDTYNLTSTFGTITNLSSGPSTPIFQQGASTITSVTLGATVANAAAIIGDSVINVPSDGTAGGGVNGLIAGDTVIIDGNTYTIQSVSDNGVTASITLTSTLTTTVSIGELIPEVQTFTVTVGDVGTHTVSGSPSSFVMNVIATSATDITKTVSDQTITTVVEVTFRKLVRNVTNANGAGGVSLGGNTYFTTAGDVRGESGDVMEYILEVTAPAATALAGVTLSDTIPSFTTYVASSTRLNGAAAGVADVLGVSALVGGVSVNDSTSGLNSGDVAAGTSALVTFQVTLD